MALLLTVLRCPDSVPPERRVVTGGEYRIGRDAARADWVLADPNQHLSRQHCVLRFDGTGWTVEDTSANGTFLNAEKAPLGGPRPVRTGDRLRLGPYEIEIGEEATAPVFSRGGGYESPYGAPEPGFGAPPAGDPFGESISLPDDWLTAEAPDPYRREPPPPAQPDHSPAFTDVFTPPTSRPVLSDDWLKDLPPDLGGLGGAPGGGFGGAPAPAPAPRQEAWQPPPRQEAWQPPPRQEAWQPPPASPPPAAPVPEPAAERTTFRKAAPPIVRPLHAEAPTAPTGGDPFGADPFAPSGAPAAAPASQPPAPPSAPLPAPLPAPPSTPPWAPPVQAAPPPAPAAAAHAPDALLAAFMAGAGLPDLTPTDPPTALRNAGAAFRAFVAGLREALMVRAQVKSALRIDQTFIQARGNNPLKFSAGDDDALTALLGTGRRTDMTPQQAVAEALRDLRQHEQAIMPAVQAGLRALLARLDPEKFRAAAEAAGGILPAQRRARAFDGYEAAYAQLLRDLADDFDGVFGKDFANAYEAIIDDLRRAEK